MCILQSFTRDKCRSMENVSNKMWPTHILSSSEDMLAATMQLNWRIYPLFTWWMSHNRCVCVCVEGDWGRRKKQREKEEKKGSKPVDKLVLDNEDQSRDNYVLRIIITSLSGDLEWLGNWSAVVKTLTHVIIQVDS